MVNVLKAAGTWKSLAADCTRKCRYSIPRIGFKIYQKINNLNLFYGTNPAFPLTVPITKKAAAVYFF
jgi:hypothetical protein